MAKAYFYIMPSADISVEHELFPTDSPNAYSLIDDGIGLISDTTYIQTTGVAGETITHTSSFRMSGIKPLDARCILNVEIYASFLTNGTGSTSITATVDGKIFEFEKLSDKFDCYTNQSFTDTIKQYDILPEIIITLKSSATTAADAKSPSYQRLYKIYIEVAYSNGINRKVNNEWKRSNAVYQKVNGIWEQIENGYDVVGSRLHRIGHHQKLLPSAEPNCTETGITEGYKCSLCGEVFIPQIVIPANGHSYIQSGGKQVCSVCQYVDGMGFVELGYHGTATSLSQGRSSPAATTVGNYALFGGGYYKVVNSYGTTDLYTSAVVDAYNTSLTRTIPTSLSTHRGSIAATTVGNYALFGGGRRQKNGDVSINTGNVDTVDAYNLSLTRIIPTVLNNRGTTYSATTVGDYALFCGGNYDSNAYDTSLTRTSAASATHQIDSNSAATTVGNYALFGGGDSGGSDKYDVVYAYDTSLTRTSATSLSEKRSGLAATTVGNYALFGGGALSSYNSDVVDVYDTSLTRTSATSLSIARTDLAATTVGNYALFGGGYGGTIGTNDTTYRDVVDFYDIFLTKTLAASSLNVARNELAATTIGNYALFGGGSDSSKYYSAVDAYELQPISQ